MKIEYLIGQKVFSYISSFCCLLNDCTAWQLAY